MNEFLASATLSVAMLFAGVANAMPIPQYDKMSQSDRQNFSVALVEGAIKALNAHGQPDQAQKVAALFSNTSENGGFHQLTKNLEAFKVINKENVSKPDNKEPVYEVEHAFGVTLKDNGIIVPVSVLLSINKDFKPSSAPSNQVAGNAGFSVPAPHGQ